MKVPYIKSETIKAVISEESQIITTTYQYVNALMINGNETTIEEIPYKEATYKNQLVIDPFNNCQIFSIGSFGNIVNIFSEKSLNSRKNIEYISTDERDAFLRYLALLHIKNVLCVDVATFHARQLERLLPPKYIKASMPYTNNTGSSMKMYLIDIQFIVKNLE